LSVTQQTPQSTVPIASNEVDNTTPSVAIATQTPFHSVPVSVIPSLSSQLAAAPVAPAKSVPAAYNPRLNPYLNQHFATQGSFSQGALQGRMPYARAVSLEPAK